jgi:hypothetical protein
MAQIFVLIDGVGLAPEGPHNPVAGHMPQLEGLLGMPLTGGLAIARPSLYAAPIDATLGVDGLPQSGTGHTTIYGGFNAATFNGRHQPSYPTQAMRRLLAERSLLGVARAMDRSVIWANAYLPGYEQAVERRRLRHTAGTWAAMQAGLVLRGHDELLIGQALSWDITQEMARARPGCADLPTITPGEAGERLARLAFQADLVAFETYLPDLAGHRRLSWTLDRVIAMLDEFLMGIVAALRPQDTLVVSSDHGNAEDRSTRVHTRNPVPLLAIGPQASGFSRVTGIDGIMGAMIRQL